MAEEKITPEQALELVTWMGVEGKTPDEFKTSFTGKYFTDQNAWDAPSVKDKFGKTFGAITSKAKSFLKQFGAEFEEGELKDKNPEDVFLLGLEKITNNHKTVLEEAKKTGASKPSEKEKELEAKLLKIQGDYTNLESVNKTQKQEFDTKINNFAAETKQNNINNIESKLWGSFAWGTDKELEKTGFKTVIKDKYTIDIDEQGNPFMIENKTKQKVPNPKVNSTFLSPEEILQKEGIEMKVFKMNQDGGKPAGGFGTIKTPENGGGSAPTRRAIFSDVSQEA
jgi:hypothetical protein